jgi:hypothetical protein
MISCEHFDSALELAEHLKLLVGKDIFAFPFFGKRVNITAGNLPYLVIDGEASIPLFDLPEPKTQEFNESGFLGSEPVHEADEEDDEEDDEEFGGVEAPNLLSGDPTEIAGRITPDEDLDDEELDDEVYDGEPED